MTTSKFRKIPQQLFTRRQAAEILGIGVYRLDGLAKSGNGPRYGLLEGRRVYSRRALQEYLAELTGDRFFDMPSEA